MLHWGRQTCNGHCGFVQPFSSSCIWILRSPSNFRNFLQVCDTLWFSHQLQVSAQLQRCTHYVPSASFGSRIPPCECCASIPGSHRWAGWSEGAPWPESEQPDGCSSQRERPVPEPQIEPPVASPWSLPQRCG